MINSKKIFLSKDWVDAEKHISVTEKMENRTVMTHMHEYFEIELILGGTAKQNLNGSPYALKRGKVYFLSPIDFHDFVPDQAVKMINISFDSSMISTPLLNTLVNHNQNIIMDLSEEDLAKAEFLIKMLTNELETNDEYSSINARNLLECILILIFRQIALAPINESTSLVPIYKSMRYLFLHFREDPSLEDIAKISGYTPTYFSQRFHEMTGKKYIEFLTSLKLNYAKMLLTSSQSSVTEISAVCGFTSTSNFNQAFKKDTGVSPIQYRTINKHI